MCGKDLNECEFDYKVKIEVISGEMRRDPGADTSEDLDLEIAKLIEKAGKKNEAELMDEIYRKMEFCICPSCQKKYLKEPIPRNFKNNSSEE